jgi:hypothetical protein
MIGKIYSMTNYFVIKEVNGSNVLLTNQNGQDMKSNLNTVQNAMQSADNYTKEEALNQTELINVVLSNPRTAMSIHFQKQDSTKTKKVYEAEIQIQAEEVQKALLAKGMPGVMEILKNPVKDYVPGEMRLIKGYYTGTQDERGRLNFIDMEDDKVKTPKGVDTRTIEYVIVNNVKYIKKK